MQITHGSSSLTPTNMVIQLHVQQHTSATGKKVQVLFLEACSGCEDNITITWSPRKTRTPWKPNSRLPSFSLLSSVA